MTPIKRASRKNRGAVMVEYVLLIVFIALVAFIGIKTFGGAVNNKMGSNNQSVTEAWQ